MEDVLFLQIAAVLITAGVVAFFARALKQPLIISYIITGLIVGPSLLGLTHSREVFDAMSEIGIAFLLFMVGLELNWRNVKDVGKIAVLAGLGQVIFTSAAGYFFGIWLGVEPVTSLFLGIAFAFSSTILIVKLLSDKEDLERFYGRISIGILIVQDIVAMLALLIVSTMRDSSDLSGVVAIAIIKVSIVMLVLWLIAHYLLPRLFRIAAGSQEMLFLAGLSWCFAVAAALYVMGFGIEVGALLAGISLAGSEFNREIEAKVRPLRDFFLIIFFIVLGTHLTFESFSQSLTQAGLFSLFVLIGNPIIVLIILRAFGYHPRTGFLVGVTMAQVSEFSFILIAAGVMSGFLDESVLGLATITALITIAGSTYLIKYNEQLYEKFEWLFRPLEIGHREAKIVKHDSPNILLFGYHHLGESIVPTLKKIKEDFTVIDFDPAVQELLSEKKLPFIYGDVGNREFLGQLNAHRAKLIISTIPDMAVNEDILEHLKQKRSRAGVILTVKTPEQASRLYQLGANFVIIPNILSGELFAQILTLRKTKKSSWDISGRKYRKLLKA